MGNQTYTAHFIVVVVVYYSFDGLEFFVDFVAINKLLAKFYNRVSHVAVRLHNSSEVNRTIYWFKIVSRFVSDTLYL